MFARSVKIIIGVSPLAFACSGQGKVSLSADSVQSDSKVLVSTSEEGSSSRLGDSRLSPGACEGYDLSPAHETLTIVALKSHLDSEGLKYTIAVERGDLHLFELEGSPSSDQSKNGPIVLRVATLKTPRDAGRHLHKALLEHGKGYWGVHRSNLAVLGPSASPKLAAAFATETGLACWGVFTQAGRDDSYVVPGGYFEL